MKVQEYENLANVTKMSSACLILKDCILHNETAAEKLNKIVSDLEDLSSTLEVFLKVSF